MRNFLEKILIYFLLATSVLLGLSFWLNIKYGFNLFLAKHWQILSQLQATHTPVSIGFYASFAFALFIFMVGLLAIFYVKHTNQNIQIKQIKSEPQQQISIKEEVKEDIKVAQPYIPAVRPPRLNIPKNMAQIAMENHNQQITKQSSPVTKQQTNQQNPYNSVLADIFKEAGYVVKPNPVISGFTCNLFAIGNNEQLWFGGVDCDINTLKSAVDKLKATFEDTLEDIVIHVNTFILDNANMYEDDDKVLVFHNIDELKDFISHHKADKINENEQENFDAYSEYIDTIIKYVRNL